MLGKYLAPLIFFLVIVSIFVNRDIIESRYLEVFDIPYYWSPLIGAFFLMILGILTPQQTFTGVFGNSSGLVELLTSSGPFSTVLLFLSIAFISLSLEATGFFRYLSVKILENVDGSGRKLFFAVFWISGLLALFTSNDIIILTLTPFLLEFLRLTDLEALPFLMAEFFAANIFSMVLLIGNETNIIAATAHELTFIDFVRHMFLPGFAGGLACFIALYFIFRDRIDSSFSKGELPEVRLDRRQVIGISILSLTLLSMIFLSLTAINLWHIGLSWAVLTAALFILPDYIIKNASQETYLERINNKMPWEIIPFLIGFFVLVQAFSITGSIDLISELIAPLTGKNALLAVLGVGAATTLAANLMNNIPMTVLFSKVLSEGSGGAELSEIYALIIGSNIGANITPIGALAGIMWLKMVNHDQKRISFREFFRIGFKVTFVTAICSLTTLYLILRF